MRIRRGVAQLIVDEYVILCVRDKNATGMSHFYLQKTFPNHRLVWYGILEINIYDDSLTLDTARLTSCHELFDLVNRTEIHIPWDGVLQAGGGRGVFQGLLILHPAA